MKLWILLLCAGLTFSCGGVQPPPNLTPAANTAFHNTQVQKALDSIRDLVDDGSKQTPPIFSHDLDVKVASWHEAIITTLHAGGTGWQVKVNTALDQLAQPSMGFSAQQIAIITPYITLAKTLVKELP